MVQVSILIPTKNRPDRCRRAVLAALSQQRVKVEVIVQDGGTSALAKDVLPKDSRVLYLREPDKSIANAVNIAASHAQGDVMHFACDDDVMTPGAAENARAAILTGAEWTYGSMQIVKYHGQRRQVLEGNGGWPWQADRLLHQNYIPQPTVFWTRKLWDERGPFDEGYPLVFDYEMWGRFACYTPVVRQHIDSYYERWERSISQHRQDEQWVEVRRLQAHWREHGLGHRTTDTHALSA